jgi:hypothetical protein
MTIPVCEVCGRDHDLVTTNGWDGRVHVACSRCRALATICVRLLPKVLRRQAAALREAA